MILWVVAALILVIWKLYLDSLGKRVIADFERYLKRPLTSGEKVLISYGFIPNER